jgi:subtilisin family serine protease
MRRVLLVFVLAALAAAAPAAAFTPADPLAPKQWYLADDHAFDAWPTPPTSLVPVKVAVIDSGVDSTLPEFAGRILDGRSFVGGNPFLDTAGHGTFVAGEIAANLDTVGTVGIAYTAQLLVAKVVKPDGTIPLKAEAAAIRWATDAGARVINLSLEGVRDPEHRNRDTYSAIEASAIAYAYAKGALLVAAVGNGDDAFSVPWPFASYPAALPHVLGVGALTRSGDVPDFSNRDPVYNDMSAPGQAIFSTFPLALTALRPGCVPQGFSDCGPDAYRAAEGTSFAAPQVSAAAAVLFGLDPSLTNSQVATLLEHTADDVSPATGCPRCTPARDQLSGWGRLDVARAVQALVAGPLPSADRFETNDDAGTQAKTILGADRQLTATADYYDDPVDVYRVALAARQTLTVKLAGWSGARVKLELWKPGTQRVVEVHSKARVAASATPAARQRLAFTAPARGWYYVEVKVAAPGYGAYTLTLAKARPKPKRR